jgi:MFS family permease
MFRQSAAPLLIGTAIQRANSGAGTVVLGLFLAQLSLHNGHHITSLQVGLLPVAFYITELSLATLMGGLSDRWGRRVFMVAGPLVGLVQTGLLFFTPRINPLPYLLALQVLAGVSGAMTTPVVLGYLADYTSSNQTHRVRIMSLYELVTSGGIAVGIVMGGVIWDRFERASFIVLAVLYLLVSLCLTVVPVVNRVVDHGHIRQIAGRYWRLLHTPRLFIFIPAWICISALVGIWFSSQLTFILSRPAPHMHQLLMGCMSGPGSGRIVSLVLGIFVLFFGLSLLFWAFFLTRVPRLRLMLTSVVGAYLACIALFGINHQERMNSLFLLWLPILAIGIFAETSFAPSALAYLADISEESAKDRGLVMGLYSIFLGLGQILGNGLGGIFARSFGFDGLIYLTVILASIALLSLLWLFRQERCMPISMPPHDAPGSVNTIEPSEPAWVLPPLRSR